MCVCLSVRMCVRVCALLVQSGFVLMEGMLVFFSCLAALSYLKVRNLSHR